MSLESLETRITRVIHHAPSKWTGRPYLIGATREGETVKGEMRCAPDSLATYRFWGEWKEDPQRGRAFAFATWDEVLDGTNLSIARYLARNVPTIGQVRARAAVEKFGPEALAILAEDPDRLAELEGVTPAHVQAIKDWLAERPPDPRLYAELLALVDGLKVPRKVVDRLARRKDPVAALKASPYAVLLPHPGVGWAIADRVATERCGVARDEVQRQAAAIVQALHAIARDGHTLASRPEVDYKAAEMLGFVPTAAAWSLCAGSTEDLPGRGVGLASLLGAERKIAARIAALVGSDPGIVEADEGAWSELSELQREGARLAIAGRIAVITGGPGTGKTFTLSRILRSLPRDWWRHVAVMAPTGKAAKRAQELIASALGQEAAALIECGTVHRLLAYSPDADAEEEEEDASPGPPEEERPARSSRWGYNAHRPLPARLVVVDETSMLDVPLAVAVLEAIGPGTRLLIVGDPDQLPSVGPGAVLRDLVETGAVPSVSLAETRRNSGRIVRACHAIRRGEMPDPSPRLDREAGENWAHVEVAEAREIAARIVSAVVGLKTFDRIWDVQVIAPQKKGDCGVSALNSLLAVALNPNRSTAARPDGEEEELVPGDKVVRIKNARVDHLAPIPPEGDFDWAEGQYEGEAASGWWRWRGRDYALVPNLIVNGDLGEVLDLTEDGWIVVKLRYPDRLVRIRRGDHHLELAYCLTVHKAQGSGFPVVVCPVHPAFYWDQRRNAGLWCRELVYTAFSRAEQILVTVGPREAIGLAASRPTRGQRRTTLAMRLKEGAA